MFLHLSSDMALAVEKTLNKQEEKTSLVSCIFPFHKHLVRHLPKQPNIMLATKKLTLTFCKLYNFAKCPYLFIKTSQFFL